MFLIWNTEWIQHQPKEPMAWSILTSGPYMEMLSEFLRPSLDENGTYVFSAPLGKSHFYPIHLLSSHSWYR